MLTGGVGGVFIVNYAAEGLFVLDGEDTQTDAPRFATDYQELMWLAEKQKRNLDTVETQRFYQLRRHWSEMHSQNAGSQLR